MGPSSADRPDWPFTRTAHRPPPPGIGGLTSRRAIGRVDARRGVGVGESGSRPTGRPTSNGRGAVTRATRPFKHASGSLQFAPPRWPADLSGASVAGGALHVARNVSACVRAGAELLPDEKHNDRPQTLAWTISVTERITQGKRAWLGGASRPLRARTRRHAPRNPLPSMLASWAGTRGHRRSSRPRRHVVAVVRTRPTTGTR